MEKGIKLKTTRAFYLSNYFLSIAIFVLLFLLFPFLDIGKNPVHYFLFFTSLIFSAALLEEPEISRFFRNYYITNDEVRKEEGIIRKKKVSISYQNVTAVKFYKGVLGRIFNFGDVIVCAGGDEVKLIGIKNPEQITKIIENKVALLRRKFLKEK